MNLLNFKWRTNPIVDSSYELLPSNSQPAEAGLVPRKPRQCRFSLRSIVCGMAAVAVVWTIYGVWTRQPPPTATTIATHDVDIDPGSTVISNSNETSPPRPPLYEEYHARERNLPQHNLSLPYPEGSHAKFLWADNHGSHFGWGNYMQEMILNAYLAYAAQRAYVFDNYTWEREGPEVSSWNDHPIPARIPLSALISGPIVGGSMHDERVPRAVSREYYHSVCPEYERIVLDTRSIQDTLDADATVSQIVDRWVTELRSIQSPCIELARSSPALFGYEYVFRIPISTTILQVLILGPSVTNTKRVLDVFPALSKSPILSNFGWSTLVLEGFYDNVKHFASSWDFDDPPLLTEMSVVPLRGLLALHIRRGDYETWCNNAYLNAMSYTGFNSFPELPDRYSPPKVDKSHSTSEITRKHCLPSIPEVVHKVLAVNAPHLTRVYVMTNAPRPWLAELKAALHQAHDWADGVGTSRDLRLSWEARFVAEAVDMYVGQRAEKFIGNGFSSLTSNVVTLRMHNPDLKPSDTHFW